MLWEKLIDIFLFLSWFLWIFNSVMVSQFMTTEDKDMPLKRIILISGIVGVLGLFILIAGGEFRALGSVMVFTAIMLWVYRLILRKAANYFQNNTLVWLENFYERVLRSALSSWRPLAITIGTFLLLFAAFATFGWSVGEQRTKIEFFPDNKPNQVIPKSKCLLIHIQPRLVGLEHNISRLFFRGKLPHLCCRE